MHEVREFAGHADIRTTEVYFIRKEEDAEVAARRIQIRVTGSQGPSEPGDGRPDDFSSPNGLEASGTNGYDRRVGTPTTKAAAGFRSVLR